MAGNRSGANASNSVRPHPRLRLASRLLVPLEHKGRIARRLGGEAPAGAGAVVGKSGVVEDEGR